MDRGPSEVPRPKAVLPVLRGVPLTSCPGQQGPSSPTCIYFGGAGGQGNTGALQMELSLLLRAPH